MGRHVQMGKSSYLVVGVIKDRRPGINAGHAEDFNKDIYIPIGTSHRFRGRIVGQPGDHRAAEEVEIHQIIITVTAPEKMQLVADSLREWLKRSHPRRDWEITIE
jgi:hypothetical protein